MKQGIELPSLQLKQIEQPEIFRALRNFFAERTEVDVPVLTVAVSNSRLSAFRDKRGSVRMGADMYHSTTGSVLQLLGLLSCVQGEGSQAAIERVLKEENPEGELNLEPLIDQQVLKGVRILDLGSGPRPLFSMIATMLGATVCTVDSKRKPKESNVPDDHHLVYDLSKKDAPQKIANMFGTEFDFVTASTVAPTKADYSVLTQFLPGQSLGRCTGEHFREIAKTVLAPERILLLANGNQTQWYQSTKA